MTHQVFGKSQQQEEEIINSVPVPADNTRTGEATFYGPRAAEELTEYHDTVGAEEVVRIADQVSLDGKPSLTYDVALSP